jgi:uncharacterized membrane protein YhhN
MQQSFHTMDREKLSRMRAMRTLPVAMTIIAVAAMLAAQNGVGNGWVMPLTFLASTGYIAIGVARGALGAWYGRCILLGLAGCWCGDMIGPRNFLAGLAAFLLGHFGFIGAFCANGIAWKRMLWGLPVLAPVAVFLVLWLLPQVPAAELGPVAAYVTVISLMVLFAVGTSHNAVGRRALLGAALFYVSDIFVACWRYVESGPITGNFCYPFYYTACIVLALSVAATPPKG